MALDPDFQAPPVALEKLLARQGACHLDVFDFELTADPMMAINALETGVRGGPEPEYVALETFSRPIPEA